MPQSLKSIASINVGIQGIPGLQGTTGAGSQGLQGIQGTTSAAGVSSFSAGTTGLTPSTGTTGAVTLAGTLGVGNGGTGVTDGRNAVNSLEGYSAFSTSGGSVTLTTLSSKNIMLTGDNMLVVLPVANTLSNGYAYTIALRYDAGDTTAALNVSGGGNIATIQNYTVVRAIVVGGAWQVRIVGGIDGQLVADAFIANGVMQVRESLSGGPDITFYNTGLTTAYSLNISSNIFGVYSGPSIGFSIAFNTDGNIFRYQPEPTSKAAAATLTISELKTSIIRYTGGAATLTLPTGTNIEGGVSGIAENLSFDFSVINTGSGTATIGTATGLTLIGAMGVAASTSGTFRVRKTATNTYTVYRL